MLYNYYAKNEKGQVITGSIEAPDEKTAADLLIERGLVVISLEESRRKLSFFQKPLRFFTRIKAREIVIFSRQLAVMVSATLPLVQALRVLVDQTSNIDLKIIISEIADEVDGGAKLSAAFSRHPDVFNDFYINMVKSGETSGKLDEVLTYLADQQEKDYNLMSKIKGAMIYPLFIICGLGVVGSLMMIFVIPKLTKILEEAGQELPLSTKILIAVSNFFSQYWWILFCGLILGFVLFKLYLKTPLGRRQFDLLKLKIPIFGAFFQKVYLIRFSRGLATLLAGGISLTQALRVVSEVVGNTLYKDLILKTVKEVEDGNPIETTFSTSKIVPPMLSQMMSVGEQTGRLDEVLAKMGDFFAQEVDNMVINLMTLIEPLIMILMGLAVGLMVAAIILPMYNLATAF
jgi:type IV pilus assembly protein PilC